MGRRGRWAWRLWRCGCVRREPEPESEPEPEPEPRREPEPEPRPEPEPGPEPEPRPEPGRRMRWAVRSSDRTGRPRPPRAGGCRTALPRAASGGAARARST